MAQQSKTISTQAAEQGALSQGLLFFLTVLCALLLVVAAVFVPPLVNANRFRTRLAGSLSASLGRPVQLDNVSLRLLPRPGFAFENLEVAEDPAFGSEPVMRAATVTVGIRMVPLLRGRLEVATISLDQASLNVARNGEGRWNFESLLQRTSRIPAQMPTAPHSSGAGARFPYFEVTNGRINFKRGAEKLPVSLTESEFSLWLETPTEWRLRFKATPVRTDMDATYTGDLRLEGSVVRPVPGSAQGIRNSQLTLEGSWQHAPLGQLSRMMQGKDSGWRGEGSLEFALNGTAEAAAGKARVRVDSLHREDFVPANPLALDARCTAQVALLPRVMQQINCTQPVEEGSVQFAATRLAWNAGGRAEVASAEISLHQVPASWLLTGLRVVRQGLAADLHASGQVEAAFHYSGDDTNQLAGSATWSKGALALPAVEKPYLLPTLQLTTVEAKAVLPQARRHVQAAQAPAAGGVVVHLLPVQIDLGGVSPLQASGDFTRGGYHLSMQGGVDLGRVAPLLRGLGAARWAVLRKVTGQATLALQVEDNWLHAPGRAVEDGGAGHPAAISGTVQLRNVTAETAWLPGELHLLKADAAMSGSSWQWQNLQWTWAGAKYDGSASKSVDCADAAACAWHLTAHSSQVDLAQVASAFEPTGADRFFDLFRADGPGGWPLFDINLQVDALQLGPVVVNHASAAILAAGSGLELQQSRGATLGGTVECTGRVAVNRGTADLTMELAHIGLANAGAIFHERWGKGQAEARILWKLARGASPAGEFTAMLHDASLGNAAPLSHMDAWQMTGTLSDGKLTLQRSLIKAGTAQIPVTGTIGLDRKLNLVVAPSQTELQPGGAGVSAITGTVQQPVVK